MKSKSNPLLRSSRLALVAIAFTAPAVFAASQTWDGGSVVNGNWGTVDNWNGAIPGSTSVTTNTDTATFNAAIANTWGLTGTPILIDANRNIGGISFTAATGNYSIGTAAGNSLLLTSGGTIEILSTLTATNAFESFRAPLVIQGGSGTYTFANNSANGAGAGAGTLNFEGSITGGAAGTTVLTLQGSNTNVNTISGIIDEGTATTFAVTKSGRGTWVLSGNNAYSGVTTIASAGGSAASVLTVSHNNALGTTAGGTSVFGSNTTGNGSQLNLTTGITVTGETLTLDSTASGYRANLFTTGTATWDGNVVLAGTGGITGFVAEGASSNLTVGLSAADTVTGSGTLLLRGGTLGNGTVNSLISTGFLSKTDNGTWTLTAANTHAGVTTLSNGILNLKNELAIQNSTLSITSTGSSPANQVRFDSAVVANAFTFGGLSAVAAGTAKNIALQNSASTAIALTVGGNNADTTYSGVLSAGGSLIKTGTGILTLTGVNTHTGDTTINGGTLSVGVTTNLGAAASDLIFDGGTLQITGTTLTSFSGIGHTVSFNAGKTVGLDINNVANTFTANQVLNQTTGGLTKTGAGTLILDRANTYTGNTTLNAGTITLNSAEIINVSGPLGKQLANAAGTIILGGGTLRHSSVNTNDYSGRFSTAASQAYKVDTNGQNITWATALNSSGGTLTKSGTGTLYLTNNSTYSGATTVTRGTLDLGNNTSNGSLASTSLTLSGARFNYTRTGNHTQSFATTNITSGVAAISVVAGNILNLGTIVRTSGTIDFSNVGAGIVAGLAASNVNGIIPGATFGNTWAVAAGDNLPIYGLSSFTLTSVAGTTAANYAAANISVDDDAGLLDGVITPSSLRFFSTFGDKILTLAAGSNVVTGSGIIVPSDPFGFGSNTISGGDLTGAANSDLIISQQNLSSELTISSAIVNNTATGLIKLGSGSLTLSNANSYSGTTNVTAGILYLSAANTISGATSVSSGAGLILGHATSMGTSTMTLGSGVTLRLRNNNTTIFTAPIATPSAGVTYTFDVNNAGSGTAKTLTLGNITFATSSSNVINVMGGNSYTLALGTLSTPSSAGGSTFLVNATTAAVTIAKISVGSFGNAVTLQGGNAITLTNFEMGANGSNSLAVSGSGTVVTLGAASQTNNRAGGSATFTLADGTLNLNNALSISNPRLSGGPIAATFNINSGTIDNTSGGALTQTANPVQNWNGDFAFTGTNDLNLGTGTVSLGTVAGATRTVTTNGGNLTVGGIISNGTNGTTPTINLSKAGVGTLTLTGSNVYTGGTTLNQGTLTVGTGGTLGATTAALSVNNSNSLAAGTAAVLNLATAVDTTTGSLNGTIAIPTPASPVNTATINNGGVGRNFTVNQTAADSYAGVIAGAGSFTLGSLSTNTLTLTGANTYTGDTTISAGTLQLGSASTTGSLSTSSAIVNNGNLTINRSNAVVQGTDFSGADITGTGSFTQAGIGTTTLNVTNTYSGGTTVSAGTLVLSHNSAAGTAGIAVSGASAAILQIDAGITLAGNNITFSNSSAASSVKHAVAAAGTYSTGTSGNLKSSFVGGQADTTAEILGGTSIVASTLEMLFKDTAVATNDAIRRSDVFGTNGTSTDTYVIQLSTGALPADSVLGWLDGASWVHAGSIFNPNTAFTNLATFPLGNYGYSGGNVWAVVNHVGSFAAVPEPTSALAGLLIAAGLLRRRR